MKSSVEKIRRTGFREVDLRYRIGLVVVVALLVAYILDVDLLRAGGRNLPQLMAVGLVAGGMGLLVSLRRVYLISFAASGLIAYQLQRATIPTEALGQEDSPEASSFDVEQYSTANIFNDGPGDLSLLTTSTADVVAVQGLSPDWAHALAGVLQERFPHQYLFSDIGLHGIGLFARSPLGSIDSTIINGIVQVDACVSGATGADDVRLIAVQTVPPVSNSAYLSLQSQLQAISAEIRRSSSAVVLLGDFNAVPWSPELSRFSYQAGVRDSRRCQMPSYEQGAPGLFEAPVEHIFYNDLLKCVGFETLRSREHYLGNRASFQSAATQVVAL